METRQFGPTFNCVKGSMGGNAKQQTMFLLWLFLTNNIGLNGQDKQRGGASHEHILGLRDMPRGQEP